MVEGKFHEIFSLPPEASFMSNLNHQLSVTRNTNGSKLKINKFDKAHEPSIDNFGINML